MAINLVKGQRIEMGLSRAGIGLDWGSSGFDLDASAFLLIRHSGNYFVINMLKNLCNYGD
jgi:stress response protein SCP2